MTAVNQRAGGKRRRLNAEINVVPYIDVMLVLLIIFMVTAPLLTQGVDVDLPQTSSEPLPMEDHPVTLTIDAHGQFYLDIGKGATSPIGDDELVDTAGKFARQNPGQMVMVRADHGALYDRVAVGMSLLQNAGITKIGFVTDPGTAGKSRRH